MSAGGGSGPRKRLSREDEEVWSLVTRTLVPLKKRKPAPAARPPESETAKTPPSRSPAKMATASHPPSSHPPAHARLQPLEPTVRRKLARGRLRPDTKIDLHGLRQGEAHSALLAFLRRAQEHDARLVVVVTGKGQGSATRPQEPWDYSRHPGGVLQRMARHWLAAPELRHVVIGFEEADLAHGGSGALYVRLRRAPRAAGDGK